MSNKTKYKVGERVCVKNHIQYKRSAGNSPARISWASDTYNKLNKLGNLIITRIVHDNHFRVSTLYYLELPERHGTKAFFEDELYSNIAEKIRML